MAQVLHIANGDTVNKKLEAKDSIVGKELGAAKATSDLVDDAFFSALARPPTEVERDKMSGVLMGASGEDRRSALEDVYWAVLSSKEFLFNH